MLCGALSNLSNGNIISGGGSSNSGGADGIRSPFSALLALHLHNMALQSPTDNQLDFLETGLLNPNYHLDPARLDDALNSNVEDEDLYQEIMSELKAGTGRHVCQVESRKAYATMDISAMGVDVTTGPVTVLDDNRCVEKDPSPDNRKPDLIEDAEKSGDSPKKDTEPEKADKDEEEEEEQEGLPPGWERHEDNQGPYYWHIKSGTIQREVPVVAQVPRSCTSSALDRLAGREREIGGSKEEVLKRRSCGPMRVQNSTEEETQSQGLIRFAVRSLGWVEVPEEELTPERSSKAVNKCIVDLSLGRNDLIDNVGRWGDGKDLFMDLDEGALKLVDPEKLTVLNTQPIHTIRVWGVGRDNGRDFAYVARDRVTRRHMCHVFRCDMPARTIANTLRDICKKIMIERSLSHGSSLNSSSKSSFEGCATSGSAIRPTNLPMDSRRHKSQPSLLNGSFPTPMEEPRKILQAQYIGARSVPCAAGMPVLRAAIVAAVTHTAPSSWRPVQVAVAPSTITVTVADGGPGEGEVICECRVRYLSFLGIGEDVRHCGFIMHTAEDTFVAHVFYCEPSSGALCKTIEAACKLRYQKCLDAHPRSGPGTQASSSGSTSGSLSATLKSLVGTLTGRTKSLRDS